MFKTFKNSKSVSEYKDLPQYVKDAHKNLPDKYKNMVVCSYNLSNDIDDTCRLLMEQYNKSSDYSMEILEKALDFPIEHKHIKVTPEVRSILNLTMSNMYKLFTQLFLLQQKLSKIIDFHKDMEQRSLSLFLRESFNMEKSPSSQAFKDIEGLIDEAYKDHEKELDGN